MNFCHCSAQNKPDNLLDFITVLGDSNTIDLDDIVMSMADESQIDRGSLKVEGLDWPTNYEEENGEVGELQGRGGHCVVRFLDEYLTWCQSWVHQTKEIFWKRI